MAQEALEFDDVQKRFGAALALDQVSFKIAAGQSVALLGPNGAGKTTAIGLFLGLRRPSRGRVRVLGAEPQAALADGQVGAMLQETGLPPGLRVSELLAFYRKLYPRPLTVRQALERSGTGELANQPVERLSGGQRRRVLVALALIGDPPILFLDEPTVGLDAQARALFWRLMDELAAAGRTILFTTHYLEEADQHAARILLLQGGRLLAEGSPGLLRRQSGGRTVRFETSLECADKVAGWLANEHVTVRGRVVTIVTERAEQVVGQLLERAMPMEGLEITMATLESALAQLHSEGQER